MLDLDNCDIVFKAMGDRYENSSKNHTIFFY